MTRPLPSSPAPWHAGEQLLQQQAGLARRMSEIGPRIIRPEMPDQHRDFFAMLSYVIVGAVDPAGDAWATIVPGSPGFLRTPDAQHLAIAARRDATDPADAGMEDGQAVGVLGIDLATRRRNRVNGNVGGRDASGFTVAVAQSFGNCPQYIRPRRLDLVSDAASGGGGEVVQRPALDADAVATIIRADTFFVASYVDTEDGRQVDVSHRGGPSGFVQVGADGVLTIPDYPGNKFYNTLGNLVVNPHAGLLFVDFARGDLLQLTGDAEVMPEGVDVDSHRGAERLWRFTPRRLVRRLHALPLRWTTGPSPAAR
jgi:predicted pyridoxine 5'-phosphate oxidase superfamily flavin-nucleotide-binding protein